ncbi:death-associated protein 1 isoform X1 [Sitodiplosis mosellana]|uniref:death-associated protein 1 isoform X1 n=1 Tax=Sitodiplosis mosellana TaxID=263140 RepID=UPI002443DFBE|nr:death-associated protein 1 isoform X1 [Sitodiplosis mosellana]
MADNDVQLVAGRQPADDDEPQLVAGRKPAVKVGGMRVVQHKPPTHKENASADLEDCTGLTQPPNINTELVSGAPVKGNADFTVQASQVAHAPKVPHNIASNKSQVHHINQPRK